MATVEKRGKPFDAAGGNAKAQIETIKAGLDCPMGNRQLPGNVYIFASFQEEVDALLFAAGESCCPDVPGLFSKPGNPSSTL